MRRLSSGFPDVNEPILQDATKLPVTCKYAAARLELVGYGLSAAVVVNVISEAVEPAAPRTIVDVPVPMVVVVRLGCSPTFPEATVKGEPGAPDTVMLYWPKPDQVIPAGDGS